MATYQEWLAEMQQQGGAAQQRAQQTAAAYKASPFITGRSRTTSFGGTTGPTRTPNFAGYNAMNTAAQEAAKFDPNSAENRAEGNRLQAYDLARGGVDRLANDPTDQFIRQALQQAAGGQGGPYDATTRNAMFTSAMEGSGHDAQVQSIMESAAQRGMDPNDPSVQAALRRAQDGQAQSAQRARLGIDLEANRANYSAQQSAVDRLGGYNMDRQAQQTSAEDRLRDMLWNEGINKNDAGGMGGGFVMSGGGRAPAPSPAPAPQPTPQPIRTMQTQVPQPRAAVGPTSTTYNQQQLAQQGYVKPVGGTGMVTRPPVPGQGTGFVQKAGQPNTRIYSR